MEYAVSENIIGGPAMIRRAHHQFGPFLAKGRAGKLIAPWQVNRGRRLCAVWAHTNDAALAETQVLAA
jgi:alkyl sulfatase BDS1-like metallo-beta-lactamase superfamily hydrolase